MIIKCQNCGNENQLGVIYCRKCGTKLDTSSLDPSTAGNAAAQERKHKALKAAILKTIRTVITLAILGAIGYAVYALLAKPSLPDYQVNPPESYKLVTESIKAKYTCSISPETLSDIVNNEILDMEENDKSGTIQKVQFTGEGDVLNAYLFTKFAGQDLIIHAACNVKKVEEGDHVGINVLSLQVGKLNTSFAKNALLKHFDNVFHCTQITELFDEAQDIQFSEGKLNIIFEKKSKKKR